MAVPVTGPPEWPDEVLAVLRCPVCARPLTRVSAPVDTPADNRAPRAVRCAHGHSFDVARQGYVNLDPGRPGGAGTGDTAAMVRAREEFLASGHFDPLRQAVVRTMTPTDQPPDASPRGLVLDAGAGTGYYLSAALSAHRDAVGLAVDTSKYAARRAARAHPRMMSVVCDVWRELPVADGVAACVLNVFAPRNGPQFRRVLRPDGVLVVVTPAESHLRELRDVVDLLAVDADKDERLQRSLGGDFQLEHTEPVHTRLSLSRAEVARLVTMGPSGHHVEPEQVDRQLATVPEPLGVTVAARVARYRPTGAQPAGTNA